MRTAKGYKLFQLRKDGSIGPLFINRRQRINIGTWYDSEDHPTKGYQHRPGWHATLQPVAPHLCERGRVWCEVRLIGCRRFKRPQSQGGTWVLAKRLKVVRVFKDGLPGDLRLLNMIEAFKVASSPIVSLGIEDDGKLYASWATTGRNRHYVRIADHNSLTDLHRAWSDVTNCHPSLMNLMCSSSVDFPEQSTKDRAVIEFCHDLRG